MAQSSWFSWTTNGTGDGTATGYTMAQLAKMLHMLLVGGAASSGVAGGYLNSLAVSNPSSTTIRVATGGALVHGTPYENDAQVDFTPGDGTYPALPTTARIHRVVLRKSWAAQTVRLAFISGTDAASPSTPALTQTDGTTWEIPLYQFQISSAGAITGAADQREFVGFAHNQAAATSAILFFRNSASNHGMTQVAETDIFGQIKIREGLMIEGLVTTGDEALELNGYAPTDNTAKTTGARAYVEVAARKKSGTTYDVPGANANLFVIRASANAAFIFDVEGSAHADVEWTTFDEHDDLALLNTLDAALTRDPAKTDAGRLLPEYRQQLKAAMLANFDEANPDQARVMLNTTKLAMLLTGALRQTGKRVAVAEARLQAAETRMQAAEQRLAALPEGPR